MIINPYRFGGFDPDAQAFITAAGLTDNTQKTAINQLVVDLKGYGIWSKMKAIYPFVGGTASTHKWNLKDPRDLDAAFRLVFSGGWTHSSTGALPNGTNAYANTYLTPSIDISSDNSISISFYSRTQNTISSGVQMGCFDGTRDLNLALYYASLSVKTGACFYYPSEAASINNTNTLGLQIISRTANNVLKTIFNGSVLATNTNIRTLTKPNRTIFIGASNWAPASQYTPHQTAFSTIGDGLTDTDATNLYNTVQAFQTTLSRQV